MSYSIYYPTCTVAVPDHIPDICGQGAEHGRVRSVAYIKKTYLATLQADPTDATIWAAGIATKAIVIIPEVSGTFDGGTPVEGKGYGNVVSKITGYNFSLVYKDPSFLNNAAFYNAMRRSSDYVVAFRTETQTQISDNQIQVIPKAPVTEELTDEVVYEVEVKFSQPDLPVPSDTPEGIFEPAFAYS